MINIFFKSTKLILFFKFVINILYFTFLIDILKIKNLSIIKKNYVNFKNYHPVFSFKTFDELRFNITFINYRFSLKYNMAKIVYNIFFFNQNKQLFYFIIHFPHI